MKWIVLSLTSVMFMLAVLFAAGLTFLGLTQP